MKINCDSISVIYMTKNQVYHARTKYIDFRSHLVRKILKEGDLVLEKIHTNENLADTLTKVVPRVKFSRCKNLLHISPVA